MVEPVLQGYCEMQRTTFVISPAADGYAPSLLSCSPLNEPAESDGDRIEIGEDFLASSMGQPFQYPIDGNGHIPTDSDSEDSALPESSHTSNFHLRPLGVKPPAILEDRTVYVRTTDLGRIGSLNGDWVFRLSCIIFICSCLQ